MLLSLRTAELSCGLYRSRGDSSHNGLSIFVASILLLDQEDDTEYERIESVSLSKMHT